MKPVPCVGMLDWGIGGIQCYRLLKAAQPAVSVLYCSDTGATPYGKLSAGALGQRLGLVVNTLVDRGATQIVFACNAASTALPHLRLPVPCTGVIEHAARLVPCGFRGQLGVIGGARTIRSGLHRRALSSPQLRMVTRIAQPLSAHIEAGTTVTVRYRQDLERIMAPLANVDALLLACTHYAAISADLQTLTRQALLLDPVPALVDFVARNWQLPKSDAPDRFVTTGDPGAMREAAARVWGVALPVCEQFTL